MGEIIDVPGVGAKVQHAHTLTAKKARYIEAYCGEALCDPTKAAQLAGYNKRPWIIGRRLEAELRDQLTAELQRRQTRKILSMQECLQEISDVAAQPGRDRLAALKLLLEWWSSSTKADARKQAQDQLLQLLREIKTRDPQLAGLLGVGELPAPIVVDVKES